MLNHEPKFKRGQSTRIPHKTPGHDRHDPKAYYRVERVFPGKDARSTTYKLKGSPSNWPETRLCT